MALFVIIIFVVKKDIEKTMERIIVCYVLHSTSVTTNFIDRFADLPNHRSLHDSPVPRIGGIAVVGVITSVAAGCWLWLAQSDNPALDLPVATLLMCTVLLYGRLDLVAIMLC